MGGFGSVTAPFPGHVIDRTASLEPSPSSPTKQQPRTSPGALEPTSGPFYFQPQQSMIRHPPLSRSLTPERTLSGRHLLRDDSKTGWGVGPGRSLYAFGFGAHRPGQPAVHSFPLTKTPNGQCNGMKDLMRSYRCGRTRDEDLLSACLSGPAYLPVSLPHSLRTHHASAGVP